MLESDFQIQHLICKSCQSYKYDFKSYESVATWESGTSHLKFNAYDWSGDRTITFVMSLNSSFGGGCIISRCLHVLLLVPRPTSRFEMFASWLDIVASWLEIDYLVVVSSVLAVVRAALPVVRSSLDVCSWALAVVTSALPVVSSVSSCEIRAFVGVTFSLQMNHVNRFHRLSCLSSITSGNGSIERQSIFRLFSFSSIVFPRTTWSHMHHYICCLILYGIYKWSFLKCVTWSKSTSSL